MKKESFIVLVFVIICMVAFFFSLRKSITNANNDKDVEYQMDDIEYFVKGVLADKDEYGTPVRERLIPIISEAYEKGDWPNVVLLVDSLINSGEVYDDTILAYAEALGATGDTNKAVEVLLKDLDNYQSSNKKQYVYNALGNVYVLQKDYENAIFAYEASLNIQPAYARPMVSVAEVYLAMGDTAKADSHFRSAAVLFSQNEIAEGLIRVGKGMVRINPNDYDGWWALGKGADLEGDFEIGQQCIKAAMNTLLEEDGSVKGEVNIVRFKVLTIQLAYVTYLVGNKEESLLILEDIRKHAEDYKQWKEKIEKINEIVKGTP